MDFLFPGIAKMFVTTLDNGIAVRGGIDLGPVAREKYKESNL